MFRNFATCLATVSLSLLPGMLSAGETEDAFGRLDQDGNGYVTSSEIEATRQTLFDRMLRVCDADKDGKISLSEYASSLKQPEPAPADSRMSGQRYGNPADAQQMIGALFTRFDKDKNGRISRKEAPDRMKQRFAMLDANRDGEISLQEITSRGQAGGKPGNSMKSRFQQMDKNRDNLISRQEAQGFMKLRFDQIDKDEDGQLSVTELREAFESYRSRQGAMRKRPE